MPIPPLNAFGVLPAGRHDCTLPEIAASYTGNPHRLALWQSFAAFLQWTANQPRPESVLIDGGFTSDKPAPKDIDIVFDLSGCPALAQGHCRIGARSLDVRVGYAIGLAQTAIQRGFLGVLSRIAPRPPGVFRVCSAR